jgi:hypothetical protein
MDLGMAWSTVLLEALPRECDEENRVLTDPRKKEKMMIKG